MFCPSTATQVIFFDVLIPVTSTMDNFLEKRCGKVMRSFLVRSNSMPQEHGS